MSVTTKIARIWGIGIREAPLDRRAAQALGVGTFVLLTSLGAFVSVRLPFTPVPMTLQVFFVLLSGAILGPGLGSLSQVIYLSLGAAGLPIFSGASGGLTHLFGPTGGYIVGFCGASLVVGMLVGRRRHNLFIGCAIMVLGAAIIHTFGVIWLSFVLNSSLSKAIRMGSCPFILVDLAKAIIAAWVYRLIFRW